ncbi:hemicentin-2 [Trichonephila clavipes]|nr:hemicentin-2 [Trichonephila clavipes]
MCRNHRHSLFVSFSGAPQVLTDTARTKKRVVVEKDEDAVIAVYFCSDPSPKRTFWEWGSIKLESGEVHIRYIAERLHNVSHKYFLFTFFKKQSKSLQEMT